MDLVLLEDGFASAAWHIVSMQHALVGMMDHSQNGYGQKRMLKISLRSRRALYEVGVYSHRPDYSASQPDPGKVSGVIDIMIKMLDKSIIKVLAHSRADLLDLMACA